jgi:DNA (cytosine-5)-methyltransferase 1
MSFQSGVLDVFCGAGGLSTGFERAGFDVIAGIDLNTDYLYTFEQNHNDARAVRADLMDTSPAVVFEENDLRPTDVDVLVGGPPCKGFSLAGNRDPDDERNTLVDSYLDFVEHAHPTVFVMENVPGLLSMLDGAVIKHVFSRAEQMGYTAEYRVLNAADFGVPQTRRRVFVVGHTTGETPQFPVPTHAPIEEAQNGRKPHTTVEQAFDGINWDTVANHVKTDHQPDTVDRISDVEVGESLYDSYTSSWKRIAPDQPAPTIKENHNAPFIHPFEDRVGTVRECAVLQGFPSDYVFTGAKSTQLKTVGNAVPVPLAEAVATSVRSSL